MLKRMTVEEKNKVLALAREGKSVRKIAAIVNFPKSTVGLIAEQKDTIQEFVECPACGKTIAHPIAFSGAKWKKYCNSDCKNRFYRESKYKKHLRSICQRCGKEFLTYTNSHQKYCCHDCYVLTRWGHRRTKVKTEE